MNEGAFCFAVDNDDDRYSRDDVAHSMFGTVGSREKGSDSVSQESTH